ncbi:pickpocket protein 28-like [Formica exsecta]|uniref:pickpocket protein 28-like n=1 Tax=Formica exsecta TaxID=72781 RepID=UPI001144318A|nr:pickpocket protein 28-like [Formica exsecta]
MNRWFYVYCKNTSLHGFRYITMNGSTMIESAFWSVVCVSSIIFCVILMLRLWDNYSNNPIVTTIDATNPIWNVSFPGVTICNNNKVYRPHADIIAKNLYANGFSINESDKFFLSLMKLIRPDKILIDNVTASRFLDSLGTTVESLMEQLMQPCSALLVRCAWIGQIRDCNKIFKTVKSREGFCCAFNSHYNLNVRQNTLNEQTDDPPDFNISSADLPGVREILKAPGSGRDIGLAIALNVERNMYKATTRPFVGASVMIHDPIDFPDIGAHTASVLPGHVLAISVTSTSIKSMESLRYLPTNKRLCFFDEETPGETRYSFQSCISECIAKNIQRLCGCLPFYYPEMHEGVRTCYLPDLDCLLSMRRSSEYWKTETCKKCLPQCTDMMYQINLEDVKMDDVNFDSDITRGLDINNMSFVYIFFGDLSYVEYRKDSIINWDSLLASFGGIFGLCLGGSVISVIELVYLLARQFFTRQLPKRQERSRTSLPPASEMFLSIPAERRDVQLQKPRSHKESNDKLVSWCQPSLHPRETYFDQINYHD